MQRPLSATLSLHTKPTRTGSWKANKKIVSSSRRNPPLGLHGLLVARSRGDGAMPTVAGERQITCHPPPSPSRAAAYCCLLRRSAYSNPLGCAAAGIATLNSDGRGLILATLGFEYTADIRFVPHLLSNNHTNPSFHVSPLALLQPKSCLQTT